MGEVEGEITDSCAEMFIAPREKRNSFRCEMIILLEQE